MNTSNPSPVQVNGEDLPKTEEFTGLGSTVGCDGGAGNNVKNRFRKARNALRMFNKIWRSQQYSTETKLKLYQSCVSSILLYGSEF